MTDNHSNYNGNVPAQANEWISASGSNTDRRVVVNPVGLAAGTYLIWSDIGDNSNILSQAQFALDMTSHSYFVRTPTALPNSWTAWTQISGPVFPPGVASWTGDQGSTRTGGVVAAAGDYTASMVTNVPAGSISAVNVQDAINELDGDIQALAAGVVTSFEGRIGAVVSANGDYTASEITNVAAGNITAITAQGALDQIAIYCPAPMALANAAGLVVANGAGWTPLPSIYVPGQSRSTQPGGTFAAAVDGITVNGTGVGLQFVNLAVDVTTLAVPPAPGQFGVRIVNAGGGQVACCINENNQTGGQQNISCGIINRSNAGQTYRIEVINNGAAPTTFSGVFYIEYLGPTP